MLGASAKAAPDGHATLASRPRRHPVAGRSATAVHAAKLPYVSGDGAARKPSLQTHATSPAVSAAALSQDALQEPSLLQPDLRVDLEKLYTMNGEPAAESSSEQSSQALEDMEALLEDLQGLDLELDAALETVLEDFSELTEEDRARLEAQRQKQLAKMRTKENKAMRVRSTKPAREPRTPKPKPEPAVATASAGRSRSVGRGKPSAAASAEASTSTSSSVAPGASRAGRRDAAAALGARARLPSRTDRLRQWGTRAQAPSAAAAAKAEAELDIELAKRNPEAFMRSLNRNTLLSGDQEKVLAKLVQGRVELEAVHASLGDSADEASWAAAAGIDPAELRRRLYLGQQAREHMIACNMRLVVSIAKRYMGRGMALQDLVSEGVQGLKRGVEKFDASKGFKFSTYAHWWIRQAVTRSISDQGRVIRLPVHLHEALARVRKFEEALAEELGRVPTAREVAAASGMSYGKLTALYKSFRPPTSYETPNPGDEDDERNMTDEYIEDGSAEDPAADAAARSLVADMEEVLLTLEQREANILRMRYGLVDGREHTLEEVGDVHRVTRERIRQLEQKALKKLRSPSRISQLSPSRVLI